MAGVRVQRRPASRRLAVAALTAALFTGPLLSGCSLFTGEGDFLKDLDGAIRTGQQWWEQGSKQMQELGAGLGQFFSELDLQGMGEQLGELCETVSASEAGAESEDPAFLERAIRAMVRTATGDEASDEQLRGVLGLLGEHCTK